MRVTFLAYFVLYVVIEVVGYQLEQVTWPEITPLDVATALTNAFLTVTVLVGVLVATDVLGHRWRRARALCRVEEARLATAEWADPGTIDVRSWRAEPVVAQLALPAARRRRSEGADAYAQNASVRPAAPPGRLL